VLLPLVNWPAPASPLLAAAVPFEELQRGACMVHVCVYDVCVCVMCVCVCVGVVLGEVRITVVWILTCKRVYPNMACCVSI